LLFNVQIDLYNIMSDHFWQKKKIIWREKSKYPLSTLKKKKSSFEFDLNTFTLYKNWKENEEREKRGAFSLWEHWLYVCGALNESPCGIFMGNLLCYYFAIWVHPSTWVCIHIWHFWNERKQRAIFRSSRALNKRLLGR